MNLSLFENAVKLAFGDPALKEKFNLKLGELHILMAHLRGIGTYINSLGTDSIGIEPDVDGPATTLSISACTNHKRAFQAHTDIICAFYLLLIKELYREFPKVEQEFRNIINELASDNDKMEPLKKFHLHLSEKLQSFIDGRLGNDIVKFLINSVKWLKEVKKLFLLHDLKIGYYIWSRVKSWLLTTTLPIGQNT